MILPYFRTRLLRSFLSASLLESSLLLLISKRRRISPASWDLLGASGRTTGSRENRILRLRFWYDFARRKLRARVRRPLPAVGKSSSPSEELFALDPALEPVIELYRRTLGFLDTKEFFLEGSELTERFEPEFVPKKLSILDRLSARLARLTGVDISFGDEPWSDFWRPSSASSVTLLVASTETVVFSTLVSKSLRPSE